MDIVIAALFVLIGILLSALTAEWLIHQRSLSRIPIRIHVNGTRGKSSVTRLITAGLRAEGYKVLGKTTGSSPRILDLLGKDRKIHRLTSASIGEQVRFLRYFSKFRPEAVVLECMAVQPQYQWVTEHRMVKSTHSVITNARLDHVDEMGYCLEDITRSLSNTIPFNGQVFTAERDNLDILQSIADKRHSKIFAATDADITTEDMSGFNHIEHPENVALALTVCDSLGIEREKALDAMRQATPDPGALRVWTLENEGRRYTFINAFAANDPQSTGTIWKLIQSHAELQREHVCAFLNTRFDRISRTTQLLDLVQNKIEPHSLVIRGDRLERFERSHFRKMGKQVRTYPESTPPSRIIRELLSQPDDTLIFGMGNIVGSGFELLDELRKYRVAA